MEFCGKEREEEREKRTNSIEIVLFVVHVSPNSKRPRLRCVSVYLSNEPRDMLKMCQLEIKDETPIFFFVVSLLLLLVSSISFSFSFNPSDCCHLFRCCFSSSL